MAKLQSICSRVNCDMIALVLLDLMMPQLSGEQVLSELQRVKPGVRVVVMSGYTPAGGSAVLQRAHTRRLSAKAVYHQTSFAAQSGV